MTINFYHHAFLEKLRDLSAKFVVIGGQARQFHGGQSTCDLDLWVGHEAQNLSSFCNAFNSWLATFPNHSMHSRGHILPHHISLKTHISLPDADVWFDTQAEESNGPIHLNATNNIDIIFHIESMCFSEVWQRADIAADTGFRFLSRMDYVNSQEVRQANESKPRTGD